MYPHPLRVRCTWVRVQFREFVPTVYPCGTLIVERPLADFVILQSLADQNVAIARALACWSVQHNLGSKMTPRYFYNKTGSVMLDETVPSSFGLSKVNPAGMWSL